MIYRDTVRPEWVDYNGHLRDAFYMLIYSLATDAFMDGIGLGDETRRARHRTLYTLEAHVTYLRELKEGAAVRVDVRVIAKDTKRIHLYLQMFEGEGVDAVSACEQMLMHIDTSGMPKAAAFDGDIAANIAAQATIAAAQASHAGRVIGLPVRRQ
ncbi:MULTISPECIES: thioesterase family protein [unclassified Caballeronia]|uniref:thioesterase family protein n=1 Tax=unclassified Caballeronia TaxID=2646786 RepID=UPI00285F604B|nr:MULTISPECIES: thioesterase family protein [unclassified Caballeronia]MDR5740607.1 thioesterase family protein [Caballeronia sp. LZ016]MDR5808870.1 thioesterase family protein [Caballeronia sp. LZ019]